MHTTEAQDNSKAYTYIVGVLLFPAGIVGVLSYGKSEGAQYLLPHGFCFTWFPTLLWLHVISDGLIALAYITIPFLLVRFALKRQDIPFDWVFYTFGMFIVLCGATHMLNIWLVWRPDYWFAGLVKALAAASSLATAGTLALILPRAMNIPSLAEAGRMNQRLQDEVENRKKVEKALQQSHSELNRRVEEQTRELTRALKQRDEFLAMLSHELRNPLAPIVNAERYLTRALGYEAEMNPGVGVALNMLRRQTAQMKRLVDDLLEVNRINQGKITLKPASMPVFSAIQHSLESIADLANARHHRITVSVDPEIGNIVADEVRIAQVLENLLSNACKYTPDGGEITVSAGCTEHGVLIRVADNGVGIDPGSLPGIFELFEQLDVSIDRSQGGLGIGLAMVKGIVSMHRGRVFAESEGRGKGSSFTIILPRYPKFDPRYLAS